MNLKKTDDSWICKSCGRALNQDEIKSIKSGVPVSCHYCGSTIAIDLYVKSAERGIAKDDGILTHPVGRLEIRQNVVPLDLEIQKFGGARDDDSDSFAPAAFQDLSDAEKQNAPPFEKICPHCGHKNDAENSICDNCGASI